MFITLILFNVDFRQQFMGLSGGPCMSYVEKFFSWW